MSPGNGLELGDIQGGILRAYGGSRAGTGVVHTFLAVTDRAAAGRWLGDLSDVVGTAAPWQNGGPVFATQMAFTSEGLRALGVDESVLGSLSEPFRRGMAARSALLGDVGDSAPSRWLADPARAHILVSAWFRRADGADAASAVTAGAAGVQRVHQRLAQRLPESREHFGFVDGFGQPAVAHYRGDTDEEGVPGRFGRVHPVAAGEFLLGYRDADGCPPPAPPGPLGRNATYMVYRELHQDVAAFRRYLAEQASALGRTSEWVASRMVGRWPDATPLALSPDRPDPQTASDPVRRNAFGYADDPDGLRCPRGAHIRRANPRDGLRFGGAVVRRRRLIRRGVPYGPPLPEGEVTDDDGEPRGIAFVAFNADIEGQFEFIQVRWCNDGDSLGLGDDSDPVAGSGGYGKMTVPGDPPCFLTGLPSFVTTRFGAYLYMPGLSGLRWLAALASA